MRIILHTKIPNNLSFVFWIFAPKMAKSANVTLIFDAKSNQFFENETLWETFKHCVKQKWSD